MKLSWILITLEQKPINPFPNKPWFLRVCSMSLLKTLCNQRFLLFPQRFHPVWRTLGYFHQIQNCRLRSLWNWKGLKLVIWERVKNNVERITCWYPTFLSGIPYWYPQSFFVLSRQILPFELYRICHELTVVINFIKRVLENVIIPAFGELKNICAGELNKISSQQSTNVRFFLSHNWIK